MGRPKFNKIKAKKIDELVSTARFADKTYHKYKLIMLYDGSQIAEYDMSSGDRGSKADSKSPESWVRMNMTFFFFFYNRDENKVELNVVVL